MVQSTTGLCQPCYQFLQALTDFKIKCLTEGYDNIIGFLMCETRSYMHKLTHILSLSTMLHRLHAYMHICISASSVDTHAHTHMHAYVHTYMYMYRPTYICNIQRETLIFFVICPLWTLIRQLIHRVWVYPPQVAQFPQVNLAAFCDLVQLMQLVLLMD